MWFVLIMFSWYFVIQIGKIKTNSHLTFLYYKAYIVVCVVCTCIHLKLDGRLGPWECCYSYFSICNIILLWISIWCISWCWSLSLWLQPVGNFKWVYSQILMTFILARDCLLNTGNSERISVIDSILQLLVERASDWCW